MSSRSLFSLSLFLFSCASSGGDRPPQAITADIWIRGGTVVDGSGGPAVRADVFVQGDSTLFVGMPPEGATALDTIDAAGLVVTPGFIDPHAHGDPFKTPRFENFLAMGVTTICLGQDGFSPETENLGEWMASADTLPLGPNIAMFTGHSTLRRLSGIDFDPDPSEEAVGEMEELLESAVYAGAFGMSTGLEYTPGTYADQKELERLAKVVGRHNGLIMSHMRTEQDETMEDDLAELFAQGRHASVHVSHMKVVFGEGEGRAEEVLHLMAEQRDIFPKFTVTADVYPYMASYTTVGILFPEWAKPPNDYEEVRSERRGELLTYVRDLVKKRNGPEATLFGTEPYKGKTLAEVAAEMEILFEELLVDSIGPAGASAAYFTMDRELQERFIVDPYVMISSDGSPTMHHPRGHGAFAKVIREYVVEDSLLTLEEAIRKMTSLPAQTVGLEKRGRIRRGYIADLLMFDPTKVKDNATFAEPHLPATGFETVIVNGRMAGPSSDLSSGKVLRRRP